MQPLFELTTRVSEDESGQDLIEYALLAAMIGVGAIATIKSLSLTIYNEFAFISAKLSSVL